MAIPLAQLKESVLIILYDYMLTSDHESFWFDVPKILQALSSNTSGAFVQRALDGLILDEFIEQGGSSANKKDLFALTENGIELAEELIEQKGLKIEEYEPAPELDLILSRLHDTEAHAAVKNELSQLKVEIKKSNSFNREADGDGDLLESEIDAASVLMQGERVRVSRLKSLLLPALRYLAKKFGDQSIGEIAKRLIVLLINLGS